MTIDVPSALPLIILKLPLHRTKGIAYGDVRVFMGYVIHDFMLRDELGSRVVKCCDSKLFRIEASEAIRAFHDPWRVRTNDVRSFSAISACAEHLSRYGSRR